MPDVFSDRFLIFSDGGNGITPRPETLSSEVFLPPGIVAGYGYGAFAFDEANYLCHRLFGRNHYQDMHVVRH